MSTYKDLFLFIWIVITWIFEFILGGLINTFEFYGISNYPAVNICHGAFSTGIMQLGTWKLSDIITLMDIILHITIGISLTSWKITIECNHIDIDILLQSSLIPQELRPLATPIPSKSSYSPAKGVWIMKLIHYLPKIKVIIHHAIITINHDMIITIQGMEYEINPRTLLPPSMKVDTISISRLLDNDDHLPDRLIEIQSYHMNILKNYDGIYQIETNCQHLYLAIDQESQILYLDYLRTLLSWSWISIYYNILSLQSHATQQQERLYTHLQPPLSSSPLSSSSQSGPLPPTSSSSSSKEMNEKMFITQEYVFCDCYEENIQWTDNNNNDNNTNTNNTNTRNNNMKPNTDRQQ